MSTTRATTVANASADTAGAPRRSSQRTRILAVPGSAAAALGVWAVAGPLGGVDLSVHLGSAADQHVGPAIVAIVSILAGLAAWGLLAVLERFTHLARAIWIAIALVAMVLSLAGPFSGGATVPAKAALAGMHLAVAAVLIPALAGRGGSR